ncbi:MAG: hypothetical protein DYH13_01770 [Alphaproteobacteria bacterium PRO2]|nr:hypothetical protein [Alphaproteobacteria bacterium PRO2]
MPALRYIFQHLAEDGLHAEFKRKSSGWIGLFQKGEDKSLDERECLEYHIMARGNENNAHGGRPSFESANDLYTGYNQIRASKQSKGIPFDVVNEDRFPFDR